MSSAWHFICSCFVYGEREAAVDMVASDMLGVAQLEAIEMGQPAVHDKRPQSGRFSRAPTMGGPQTVAVSLEPMSARMASASCWKSWVLRPA